MAPTRARPLVAGGHLFRFLSAMSSDGAQRRSQDLDFRGLDEIDATAKEHIKIVRDHGTAMTAQQHGGSIAESRSDFVAQSVIADQQWRIVNRCAAVKVNAAIGDNLNFLSGSGDDD